MSDDMMLRCFLLLWAPGYSVFKSGHTDDSELLCIRDELVQLAADKTAGGDVARFLNKMTQENLYQLKEFADREEGDDSTDGSSIISVYNRLLRFRECKKTVRDIILEDCFGPHVMDYVENRLTGEEIRAIKLEYRKKTGGVSLSKMLESLDSCAMRILIFDEVNEFYQATCNTAPILMQPIIDQLYTTFPNQTIICPSYPGIVTLFMNRAEHRNPSMNGNYLIQLKKAYFDALHVQMREIPFHGMGVDGNIQVLCDPSFSLCDIAADAYNHAAMLFCDRKGRASFQGELSDGELYSMCHQAVTR